MEILNKSSNVTKTLEYKLSHQTRKMSELVGAPLKVEAWINYTDTDFKTGELKEVVSICYDDTAYATISESFVREFKDIVNIFGADDLPELKIVEGKSKAGRTFITVTVK